MKKLCLMLCLMLCLLLTCTCALAEDADPVLYQSGDWWYTLQADGTAGIVGFDSGEEEAVIPETLDGLPVTAFADTGYYLFTYRLTSITIPDCLTRIGENPFAECDSLTEIKVSLEHPTLAVIDGVLFEKTEKRLVCYPSGLEEASYAIPQGIRIIGDSAFSGCSSLTSITIPDSVTAIDAWAFTSCKALEGIALPQSVSHIGDYAFFGCDALTSIAIPDSVITIGANPFTSCQKLTSIRVSPDHPTLAVIDDVLFEKTEKRLVCYPLTNDQPAYSIPQGIRVIGASAFRSAELTAITIPDSVTTIADEAFLWCNGLTEIVLPGSLTAIGNEAFAYCEGLTAIDIPEGVTSLGNEVFDWCKGLTSVTLPESLESIGQKVFSRYADSLTITVSRNSYAAQYCKENDLNYTYPDALDWLLN